MADDSDPPRVRYELIPEEPRVVTESGEFRELADRICDWAARCESPDTCGLRVGGVWGGRGTGKTSMLVTVLESLRQAEDSGNIVLPAPRQTDLETHWGPLFEPSKLLPDDRLLLHLISFLQDLYWAGESRKCFGEVYAIEAKIADSERFLGYAQETAVSDGDLTHGAVEFFKEIALRKATIKKSIDKAFGVHDGRRLVLLIDDLDLQPQWAHELLRILHVFFSDVRMSVILAADRSLLAHNIERDLRQSGVGSDGLAFAIVAKYVGAEWPLPVPSPEQRKGHLWAPEGRGGVKPWWDDVANAPMFKVDERKDPPPDPEPLFGQALPSTWRGINRVYNRMVTLNLFVEADKLAAKYAGHVGSPAIHVPAFLSLMIAVDESYPELRIWEAFEHEPDRLREGLSVREDGRWRYSSKSEVRLFPVRDLLWNDRIISGRRRGQAEALLMHFGMLWEQVWVRSANYEGAEDAHAENDDTVFVGLSVQRDAMADAQSWWDEHFVEDDRRHFDHRGSFQGPRPTPAELVKLFDRLRTHLDELRGRPVQIFAYAPLSLLAWLGWHMRYEVRSGSLQVLSKSRTTGNFTLLKLREHELGKEFDLLEGINHEVEGDPGSAAIVVDVRPNPSPQDVLEFVDVDGAPVSVGHYIKLVSDPNFELEQSDQVANVVHDLQLLLTGLRSQGVRSFHIGFACPGPLALLLGSALNPWIPIYIYEHIPTAESGPRYVFVTTLG